MGFTRDQFIYKIDIADFVLMFFSSRRRHPISLRDWSSDVCSSDLLISGRFHWFASNRPTLPRPQLSMSQTWFAVYPLWTRNCRRRRDSRRLATVAPLASSVILGRLLDRAAATVYRYLSCES